MKRLYISILITFAIAIGYISDASLSIEKWLIDKATENINDTN
jgi:hypothetical protein